MNEIGQIVAGLLVGYLIVTLCESLYHRFGGHAPRNLRQLSKSLGPLGRVILDRWYSHAIVHHRMTYRNSYVRQFSSAEEKEKLILKLAEAGNGHVSAQSFGLRVGGPIEHLRYILPTAPYVLIACWCGGAWFSIGAILPLIIMPLMSEFIHPLLHLPYEVALRTAQPFIKPFVETGYFKYVARHHWLHHRHPESNFNLMLGGDLILRCHRSPTPAEIAEMSEIQLCMKRGEG